MMVEENNIIAGKEPQRDNTDGIRRVNVSDAIRAVAKVTGLALIALFAMQIILSFAVQFFVVPVFGVPDPETNIKYLDDTSVAYYIVYFIQYFIMFIPPLMIMALASGEKGLFRLFRPRPAETSRLDTAAFAKYQADIEEYGKLRRRMVPEVLLFLPMMMASAYVMSIVANFIEKAFNMFGLISPEIFMSEPATPIGWAFYILTLCVVAPICEEMFFRGAVMKLLKPFGAGFAIACQAILFSVFHGTVAQLPYTVVGGLLLGYVAYRFGGILPAMMLHALNNGMSLVISSAVPDSIGEDQVLSVAVSAAVYTVMIVGAFITLKILARSDKKLFKPDGDPVADRMPGLSAFRIFLAHPAVIVYYCVNLGLMLFNMLLNGIETVLTGMGM